MYSFTIELNERTGIGFLFKSDAYSIYYKALDGALQ